MNIAREFRRLLPGNRITLWVVNAAILLLSFAVLYLWSGPEAMWSDVRPYAALGLLWAVILSARAIWIYSRPPKQHEALTDEARRNVIRSAGAVFGLVAGSGGFMLGQRARGREFAPTLDLQGRYILRKRFALSDLTNSRNPWVEDKEFDECDIHGPAVIFILGTGGMWDCSFEARDFPGTCTDKLFIETDQPPAGSIIVKDCRFRKCYFHHVGIAAERQVLDVLRRGSPGLKE